MSAAVGPVVGGLLVAASWRWVFLVNVPIGIAALVVGWRRLPHIPGHPSERPDPLGVVLATAGVASLTFGLVKGSDWGWGSAAIVGTLAASAALVALFILHCLRSRTPLIHPSLFASRSFTGASLVAIFFSASFAAMLLSIVLWEQGAWGWSALQSGLAIAPGPLMVPFMSFLVAGRLIARYGPARVIALGSVAFGAGVSWWALAVTVQPNYVAGVLGGMILTGIGRRSHPSHHDGHGGILAAAAVVRHRLGGHQHDPPDRRSFSAWPSSSPCSALRPLTTAPLSTPSDGAGGSPPPSPSSASSPPSSFFAVP